MAAVASEKRLTTSPGVEAATQRVVAQHLGLVYHVARALMRGRGIAIELDELVSAGTLGLIDALKHFDPSRGFAFTTFAAPRIRGAMLDELRRLDHVPRSVRRRARILAAASDAVAGVVGGAPPTAQVASRLGIDLATLWQWQSDGQAVHTLPLERTQRGADQSEAGEEYLSASDGCEVDEALTREQELTALADAIRALGSRDRTVLTLYYFEELRLHEIADVLGVSESRVSQIRTQAIARLRRQMMRLRDVAR